MAGRHSTHAEPSKVIVTTVAGGSGIGFKNGCGAEALFDHPVGLAIGLNDTCFVIDHMNNRVRAVELDGSVTSIAGTGEEGANDGPGSTATFSGLFGITTVMHHSDDIYLTENSGNRVRKISRSGVGSTKWVVSTVVADDGTFDEPRGIAYDERRNCLAVVDGKRNRIVHVSMAGGNVTELATSRPLQSPSGIHVMSNGDTIVTEENSSQAVRIAPDASVTFISYFLPMGHSMRTGKDGKLHVGVELDKFCAPAGATADRKGTLIICERSINCIKVIDTNQNGKQIYDTHSRHSFVPQDCAINSNGALLVCDVQSHCIRMITGLGLKPLTQGSLIWTSRFHRVLGKAYPAISQFVRTVVLCAQRVLLNYENAQDTALSLPPLPQELWLLILSMLETKEMGTRM